MWTACPFGKPPYGTVTAINLNTGDHLWQVPNGPTPDEIKDNPALKGVNIPPTGIGAQEGVAMNKTLIFQGDGAYVTQPGHPRGAYLRGRDQKTGAGSRRCLYAGAAIRLTNDLHAIDGKEYIMIAVSGGNYSGDYLAFALPQGPVGNKPRQAALTIGSGAACRSPALSQIAHSLRTPGKSIVRCIMFHPRNHASGAPPYMLPESPRGGRKSPDTQNMEGIKGRAGRPHLRVKGKRPMTNRKILRLSSVAAIALAPFVLAGAVNAQGYTPSTAKGDWPMYFADLSGSRYLPADQINAANFNKLELAWHFKTDALGSHPEFKLEGTPIEINGTIYTTAGSRRAVVALDAKTGELKWVYSMNEGLRAAISPRQLSGRGVSFWTDGNGDDRIIYSTTGYRLVALNAHTDQPIESFGDHGIVDLKVGAYTGVIGQPGVYKQIDLTTGEIGLHTVPTVAGNAIFVGSSFKEGSQPLEQNNTRASPAPSM